MAKKVAPAKKVRKPKEIKLPPLAIRPPTELRGSCACVDATVRMVRLPHVPRLDWQMITAFCQACGGTFYLTEK